MNTTSLMDMIKQATGAHAVYKLGTIQSLWSGYGEIVRYALKGGEINSVIVKHVKLPTQTNHPRGWNSDISHQRKIKSYEVETAWYRDWSQYCDADCRIPQCLALGSEVNEVLMILEDLDASGFPQRRTSASMSEIRACLAWLANFHAIFMKKGMNKKNTGLWPIGTYWHLATRPDELQVLDDLELKQAAGIIDQKLQNSSYQSLVHGDAKLANFCFSHDGKSVAAVDFQYVGGGCGMKDVAYFISSCFYENDCERYETELLDDYFGFLKTALETKNSTIDPIAVEQDWRSLYPIAWTDFHRFLKGWSPGHWKIHSYSERISREVLAQLNHQQS